MRGIAAVAIAAALPAAGSAQTSQTSVEQIALDGSARRVLLADASWVTGPLDRTHVVRVVPEASGATIQSVSLVTGAVRTFARADGPPHAVAVAGGGVAFGTCVPAERSCARSAVWVARTGETPAQVAEVDGSVAGSRGRRTGHGWRWAPPSGAASDRRADAIRIGSGSSPPTARA
jgi:hypothetical protein